MAATWLDPLAPATSAAVAALGRTDVYHDPAYVSAVAGEGQAAYLLVEDGGLLLLPLILRPVPEAVANAAALGRPLVDAESPYGYAAPVWSGDGERLWAAAATALAERGVVNAFLRNHPLAPWVEPLPALLRAITSASTAAIPLDGGRAAAFGGSRVANHRSQVNRARSLGFTATVQAAPDAAALAGFRDLYERTMTRLGAADFYHFGDGHWRHLIDLGQRLALISIADPAGAVHNQALFMRGPEHAHYHLSARSDDAHNASGNLLFEAAADWALASGPCTAIHLGGGTSGAEDDSLLAYKRRIGKRDCTFRTAGLIADPVAHDALVAAWVGLSGKAPRWFQAYRAQ